tara:strand:- start:2079 stop:2372 length:294 start_codon:yes stop_codon:yes gene_type:complete
MVRRRYIVSGSDINNITNMLDVSPNFTAALYSTSSCGIDNLVYCDIEWEQESNDDASILKSINNVSEYCDDHSWVIAPPYASYGTGSLPPPHLVFPS